MYEYTGKILEIHDGDTIRIDLDLGLQIHQVNLDCRFYGVDAPELGRPDGLGEKARGEIVAWLTKHPGPYVMATIKDRTEKYGRYLLEAITAADGRELIGDLLAAGFLKPYTGHGPKPEWAAESE
jgi:endonuclease YncB( thermonuclease family)